MAREFYRSDRVGDAIQRSLAPVLQQEMRDPRLGMVNVNSVDVTRDLSLARVYVTVVGSESDKDSETSVKILNNAASFLRNLIAKDLTMRSVPRLQFYYDKAAVHGQALSSLIDRAVAQDQSRHDDDKSEQGED